MKTTTMIARILLGLTFLVFGLNGFFQFIKLGRRRPEWLSSFFRSAHFVPRIAICDKMRFASPK
jgi:hypothetical protein